MYRRGRRESLSREELTMLINRDLECFAKRGPGSGERILCIGPLSPYFFVKLIALFACGATAVLPPPVRTLRELVAACRDIRPRGILAPLPLRILLRFLCPPAQRPPAGTPHPLTKKVPNAPARVRPEQLLEDVLAPQRDRPLLLSSSSGTGGLRHSLVRTGADLATQSTRISRVLEYSSEEKEACGIQTFALNNIASGMEAILIRPGDWRRPARLLRILRRENPDRLSGSPSLVNAVCRELANRGETLPRLRRVICGGAPIHYGFVARCREHFPNARISLVYGSTEAQPIAILDSLQEGGSEKLLERMRLAAQRGAGLPVGRPVSNTDILILPAAGGPVFPAAPGGETIGEVLVRGEGVNNCYLDIEPKDNPSRWYAPDGSWYHRTGDLGYLDANDGSLFLVGRLALTVESPGGPLHPYPVEALACLDPAVERAALVPAPTGPRGGTGGTSAPLLFIQRGSVRQNAPRIREEALRERLGEELSRLFSFKAEIVFLSRIPLDTRHAWRNDYRQLRTIAAARGMRRP